jgi:hypothetical protein
VRAGRAAAIPPDSIGPTLVPGENGFAEPPRLATPIAIADPSSLTCSTTGPGTIPPPGSVTG